MKGKSLEAALAALRRDWSRLEPRIRVVNGDVVTQYGRLSLRLHYPALRDARATIGELIDVICLFIPNFSLPRSEVEALYAKKDGLDAFEFHAAVSQLNQRALALFKRVRKASNRSGEAGELLLYLLTEWILGAPQIIAKMGLKTNPQMPVHGSDGVHVRVAPDTGRLLIYSGEAKFYSDLGAAVRSAVKSIGEALTHEKMRHELELVQRHIDFAGLPTGARDKLLRYLDPFDEAYNERVDVVTCLIGFDFDGYSNLAKEGDGTDASFERLAIAKLRGIGPTIAQAMADAGLSRQRVELFLLPVPSVDELRDKFQDRIGWKDS